MLLSIFWFWSLICITVICIIAAVATTSPWSALFTILIYFILLCILGYREEIIDMWKWIKAHPLLLLLYFIVYISVGISYSLFKWYHFLLSEKSRKERFNYVKMDAPQISEHKEKLFTWIFYWPAGTLWDMIDRPFRKLFNAIYNGIAGKYQRMSDKMFKQK